VDRAFGCTLWPARALATAFSIHSAYTHAKSWKETLSRKRVILEIRIVRTGGEVHVEDLPVISADPTQMRQLFQNLIGNALKFHKPGEKPMVRVRSISNTDSGCQIVVEDNGIGFEEKYLDRIFAPFHRLHARSEYEGTGMGLAICKKIVERHGGSITAKSTPGAGSTFIIELPVKQTNRTES
jgi:signal transduction histidine kinase